MDFLWDEEQIELKKAMVKFARTLDSTPKDEHGFSRASWQACADFGVLALLVPEDYGGLNIDELTVALVLEGLGYGCRDNGLLFALNAHLWGVQHPIQCYGTPRQIDKYIRSLCNGEAIGALAMTEPDSGSDAFSLRTQAQRRNDGYVINGNKTFVTNAPIADLFVVYAGVQVNGLHPKITAFIVEGDMPGVRIGQPIAKMGLQGALLSQVFFDDCYVPRENRLGAEGAGRFLFNKTMDWERTYILATYIGTMQRILEEAIDYARQRQQFGQPISRFESVSNRIVEMKLRLETARLLLYKTAWLKSIGQDTTLESAMVKLYLSESLLKSAQDALRIRAGYGYMTEFGIERDLRDAFGCIFCSGTSDLQRQVIAKALCL